MTRFVLACACCIALVAPAWADQGDEGAIKAVANDFVAAWNRHDATALAKLWTTDGSFISSAGETATNRQQVEELLRDDQTGNGPYRQSTYQITRRSVQSITPTVAVADWQAVVSGILAPDGAKAPPQTQHVTVVLKKENGTWKFAAVRPGTLHAYEENTSALQSQADAAAVRAAAQAVTKMQTPANPTDNDNPDDASDVDLPSDKYAE